MEKSKSLFLIILVLVILGLGAYGYWQAVDQGDQGDQGAKITVEPKEWDFGEVSYGQIVEYSFKVKNIGNEILEIKRVATSCACATAKIAKEKINPGEEAELQVSYDTGAMSGPHGKGNQERIVYLKSNDPENPQVEIMIYANVK